MQCIIYKLLSENTYLIWWVKDNSHAMDGRNRCPASRTQARAVVVRRVDIATVAPDDDAVDQHQSSSDRSTPVLGGHCNFRLGRGSPLSGSSTRWRDLFRFRCSWSNSHRYSPTKIIMIIL